MLSKTALEASLAHKSPGWWAYAAEQTGKENYYHCESCRHGIVTVDRDTGTTPMTLSCKATEGCRGRMVSRGYPDPAAKPAWLGPATWEWYRPDEIDDDDDSQEIDHIMNGGLLLRKVVDVVDGTDQA